MLDMGDKHWSAVVVKEDPAAWIVPYKDKDKLRRFENDMFVAVTHVISSVMLLTGGFRPMQRDVDLRAINLGGQASILSGPAAILAATHVIDGEPTGGMEPEPIKEAVKSVLIATGASD
jgi:hypothetical protein